MLRSSGVRLFIVGLLIFLMNIPLLFVSEIINDRSHYNRSSIDSVGREWGGRQLISGPVLVVPVQETVKVNEKHAVLDPETKIHLRDEKGNLIYRYEEREKVVERAPVYLYPNQFDMRIETETQERHRGIFTVPVYTASADVSFDFPVDDVQDVLAENETPLWREAGIELRVTSNRALRGEAVLLAGEEALQIEPLAAGEGLRAPAGDPRKHGQYSLSLGLNGAQSLSVAPVGRTSRIDIVSDWRHPSFKGAFLPDAHEITNEGFTAQWVIPHLARSLPQASRADQDQAIRSNSSFGVDLYQPNDFYQKSYRAARYGLMFIGLTFLTIFLIEGQAKKPTHPVQYLLVGLAQSVFFLLMLSLAEHFGFGAAYLIAAGATVLLIAAFAATALRLGRRSWVVGALLALLYAVLYLILRSADFALLAGSILAFGAIAATMYATRNENWYGEGGKKRLGWFQKPKPPEPAQPTPQV